MCGRFSLGVDTDRLVAEFGLGDVPPDYAPRYNIAPTQPVAAVVAADGGLRSGWLRWGLAPERVGRGRPLINARAETVHTLPSFADSFRRRRCWVLADGFYEWRRGPEGGRTAFHIRRRDQRPFAFAAIWDRPVGHDGQLASCAILTTRPAPVMVDIHDRMPVILGPDHREAWLDPRTDRTALEKLLEPSDDDLEAVQVSARVNSVRNDDPACMALAPRD